jgi:hypothetical protein
MVARHCCVFARAIETDRGVVNTPDETMSFNVIKLPKETYLCLGKFR